MNQQRSFASQEIFNKQSDQDKSQKGTERRLLRLKQIIPDKIPISKSSWWAGVKTGKYPKPMKLGERTTVWRESEIDAIIAGGVTDDTTR
jgi:prophage regulatory protein